MKKFISMSLALTMFLSAGSVFAEDVIVDPVATSLIYNNKNIIEDGAAPFINNDRTMLPFRSLLTQIGAKVDYSETSRIVNAKKDDTEISFSLDDTYIDVTKNGETKRIVQDVKNVIKDDSVYVPIRFMSEAFDLDVGWDDVDKTAMIVDIPQYIKELNEKAPDLKRYMEIASKVPESYTQTMNMVVDFNFEAAEAKIAFKLDAGTEFSLNNGAAQADAAVNLNTNLFKEIAKIDIQELKDVKLSFKYNDSQLYVNTNLVDKLKELMPENEKIKRISGLVNSKTWFKAEINELFETLGLPVEMVEMVKMSLNGKMSEDYLDTLFETVAKTDLTSVAGAEMVDTLFNIYGEMFADIFTIKDLGKDNYDIQMNIPKDKFLKIMESAMPSGMSADEEKTFKATMEKMNLDCTSTLKVENNVVTSSNEKVIFGMDIEGIKADFSITSDSILKQDTKKDIVMPESALNLIDIIKLLK